MSQLLEFGAVYVIIMAAALLVVILDTVSMVRCLFMHREELTDYAEFIIKYAKIAMLALMGAYYIFQTFDSRINTPVRILHIMLGVLAAADAAASLAVKLGNNYAAAERKARRGKKE